MKTQWLQHSFGCPDQYRSVVPGPVPSICLTVIWPLPTFDSPPSPPNLARPRRCLSPNGRKFARPVQWNSDKQIWPFGPPPPYIHSRSAQHLLVNSTRIEIQELRPHANRRWPVSKSGPRPTLVDFGDRSTTGIFIFMQMLILIPRQ